MTLHKQICSLRGLPVEQKEWVMIFPAGKTQGHDGRGPYVLDDAEAVIAASVRPEVELVIERDHVTDLAPPGTPIPAAGWIKELKAIAGAIFARIEWTPPAEQQLKHREYRYISPTFLHDQAGKVKQILRASLTNDPNFEMKAIASVNPQTLTTSKETTMDKTLQDIAALLGLEGESISAEAVLEAVKTLKASVDAVKESVDAPAEAETPEAIVDAVESHIEAEVKKEVASQLKKATAAVKTGAPDPSKYVPIQNFNELKEQVASLSGERADEKATAAVEQALKDSKIIPSQREWALAYAKSDPEGFAGYVKASPALLKATAAGHYASAPESQLGVGPAEEEVARQLGLAPDKLKDGKKA